MQQLPQSAADHYAEQQRIVAATVVAAGAVWGTRPPSDFDVWFQDHAATLVDIVAAGQARAVAGSGRYVAAALAEMNVDRDRDVLPNPSQLVGIASDGRDLASLLRGAIIVSKANVAKAAKVSESDAVSVTQAWAAGREALERRVLTQVADAERSATMLEISTRPRLGYTRLARSGGCSRCTILAGRFYRWNEGFLRHPRCMCRHVPATTKDSGDLISDPREAFDSLSREQQDKIYTRAGAEAIRSGADIRQVVNVRRGNAGLQTGAGRITRTRVAGDRLFVSSEGTTRRGIAGQIIRGRGQTPATSPRLMPESIAEVAEDRDDYLRLLKANGYTLEARSPSPEPPNLDKLLQNSLSDGSTKPEFSPTKRLIPQPSRTDIENNLARAEADLVNAADRTALDAMPLQARAIVARAELRTLQAGSLTVADVSEKVARKLLDVETRLADPAFDLPDLSGTIGEGWREMYRDEWRRNMQDVLHNEGVITVKPTREWPLPGLKRKGALQLHRTGTDATAGRTIEQMRYDVARTNPNYDPGTPFGVNCQRAVQAYELRARGYDVTAAPNLPNSKQLLDADIFGGWGTNGKQAAGTDFEVAKSPAGMRAVAKAWGLGARGWITVDWKAGLAHIYNVEVDPTGTPRFYDAQIGISDADKVHEPTIDFGKTYARNGARMYRVDTKVPVPGVASLVLSNPTFIKAAEEVAR